MARRMSELRDDESRATFTCHYNDDTRTHPENVINRDMNWARGIDVAVHKSLCSRAIFALPHHSRYFVTDSSTMFLAPWHCVLLKVPVFFLLELL